MTTEHGPEGDDVAKQPEMALRLPVRFTVAAVPAWLVLMACSFWGKAIVSWSILEELGRTLGIVVVKNGPLLASRLAWLAALWLVAVTAGSLWMRVLRLRAARLEALLLASALGFGTLSLVLLGLGAAGFFSPIILKIVFLTGTTAALIAAPWVSTRMIRQESQNRRQSLGPEEVAALLVMATTVVMESCAALAPAIYYDALLYHLALPKLYLLNGRLFALPHNVFSGLPMGMQMLYGLTLSLSDERLAALLHSSLGWAAAAAVYCTGRRLFSRRVGILAAFLTLVSPVAVYAGWNCGVDLGAAFFCATGLLAVMRDLFPQAPIRDPEAAPHWPACAGLLLGFACGVKYNVLPFAAVLFAVHAWQNRRQGRSARAPLLLAFAAACSFSPWLIKDIVLFHDPLYPFLRGIFGVPTQNFDLQAFSDAAGSRHLGQTLRGAAGWKDLLLQPWTVSAPESWIWSDSPGPLFLTLLPWILLLRPRKPAATAVAAAAAGGYVAWTLATRVVRYLLPAFSFLALAAALAVEAEALPRWLRRLGWVAAIYGGTFAVQFAFAHGKNIGFWQCLTNRVDREDYLKTPRDTYPMPYYAAAEFINRELSPAARVLLLGESRTYYIERDCIAATVFDQNPFWLAAQQASDGKDLLSRLRGLGVTHVFLNAVQLAYQGGSTVFPRETARRAAFTEFWGRHLKKLYEEKNNEAANPRWLAVYELVDKPNPDDALTPNPASEVLLYLDGRK
ncbi:MAG: ArnT family glycosyltransferase [Elusimicrobiota bacterium]